MSLRIMPAWHLHLWQVTTRYYSPGELQGNSALYDNTNHLGSVLGLLDAQGKSLGQTSYGPYGEPEQTQGKTSDYRYAGMYSHPSTGLYLTHYRFYDPQSGRWLNRDPIGEKGGINIYAYVGGDPLNRIDLLGLTAICPAKPPRNQSGWKPYVGNSSIFFVVTNLI